MKKLSTLLLLSLACCAVRSADDNTFYFPDAIVMPGQTTNIGLCVRNTATDLTCLEAEVRLPEGLSFVVDEEGNPMTSLCRNRIQGHELLANVLDDGSLKLLVSSIDGNPFSGDDGLILTFRVQAAEGAPVGECSIESAGESLLVDTEAEAYYASGVKGIVLITDDATGLQQSMPAPDRSEDIYDLSGRKVTRANKGIFIRAGKKELHK